LRRNNQSGSFIALHHKSWEKGMAAAANSAAQSFASYHDAPVPWPPGSRAGPPAIPRASFGAGLVEDHADREALWPRAVVFLGLGLNIVWLGFLAWGFVELVVG
jgi:hypothetical protein